jgi:hypothetical protein
MRDARASANGITDVQDVGTDAAPKITDDSTPKIGDSDAK